MGRFTGRAAIVTGASRGIGAALAERLAAEGADVLVVARTVDRHDHLAGSLNETVEQCRRYGTKVEALGADLSDPDSRAQIVPTALEMFGRVDVLVNNAAAAIYAPLAEYPLRRRLLTFEVNVHAPVDLAQAVLPSMLERWGGLDPERLERHGLLRTGPPEEPRDDGSEGRCLRRVEGSAQSNHPGVRPRTGRHRCPDEYGGAAHGRAERRC